MKEGRVPLSAIDMDARGVSIKRKWISEYKLSLVTSTYSPVIVPLSADVTLANLPENQVYEEHIIIWFAFKNNEEIYFIVAHLYYDDQSLDLNTSMGFQLVSSVHR